MKILPLLTLLILTITVRSQTNESFYVFNADWKPTKIDSAHFLLRVHPINDTCWQWDYYNFTGPLLKTEQFRDKDGNELDGFCHHFNETMNGNIEGEVRVLFIVGKDGQILDPSIAKSVEYSLDEESLRMINGSGKWTPGFQNGKFVKTYKIQPINFRLK